MSAVNIYKFGTMIRLAQLASDPATAENGTMYYNTTSNNFRVYKSGAWIDSTTGAVALDGQSLNEFSIIVGDSANESAKVDTAGQGDISASTGGLVIKSLAITNSHIATSAAIARSKLASGTAYRLVSNDASGVMSDLAAITAARALVSDSNGLPVASSVTSTELSYVGGVTSAIQTQLNDKLNLSGGTMSGAIAMGSNAITGMADPTNAQDAATKFYVDSADALKLNLSGGTMSGAIAMGTNKITGLGDPTAAQDAATQNYVVNGLSTKLSLSGGTMTGNLAMGNNKITGLASGTASTDAVNKAQLDAAINGVFWLNPIADADLIDDSLTSPPGSPVQDCVYIAAATAGAWTAGHAYYYNTVSSTWIDILGRAVAIGDRFGVTLEHGSGFEGGGLTGKHNQIAQITNATPGAITYAFTVPVDQNSVFVNVELSPHFGHSYSYNATSTTWVEFGGPSATPAGIGLSYSGNTLNVNLGAGIMQLPTDEVGIDCKSDGGIDIVDPTSGAHSTATNAQLSLKLDGGTLSKSSSGVKVAALGITNGEISTSAAIAFSKMAALTASRALVSDASGVAIASSVTSTELGYVSGVTSSIQTQLNTLSSGSANTTLSNLGVTAINAHLYPDTANNYDLGSSSAPWRIVTASTYNLKNADGYTGALDVDVNNVSITTGQTNGNILAVANGTGKVVAKANGGLVIQHKTSGAAILSTLTATLAASQTSFVTVSSALNFLASDIKSKHINYEIVDSVTGHSRTGTLRIAVGNVAAGAVGFSDAYVSSNTALDTIEFLPVVNTGTGNCDIQYKGTGSNSCTFKVLQSSISVNNSLF